MYKHPKVVGQESAFKHGLTFDVITKKLPRGTLEEQVTFGMEAKYTGRSDIYKMQEIVTDGKSEQ